MRYAIDKNTSINVYLLKKVDLSTEISLAAKWNKSEQSVKHRPLNSWIKPDARRGDQQYLASLLSGSGTGWHTRHPSSCGRRTRTAPPPAARGGTAVRASATGGSRWRGANPFCGTLADGHPETCGKEAQEKKRSVNNLKQFVWHADVCVFKHFQVFSGWFSIFRFNICIFFSSGLWQTYKLSYETLTIYCLISPSWTVKSQTLFCFAQ